MEEECNHVERVSVHSSIRIGGTSIGKCKNKVAPGLVCCWEHATKECLIYYVKSLLKENSNLKKELETHGTLTQNYQVQLQ